MKSTLVLAGVTAFATSALGHATFQQLWVDGKDQQSTCARLPTSNSPVQDVSSTNIRCTSLANHADFVSLMSLAGNANQGPAASKCSVAAGGTVTIEMHQQNGDRSCANEAIGGAHYGMLPCTHVPAGHALMLLRACYGVLIERFVIYALLLESTNMVQSPMPPLPMAPQASSRSSRIRGVRSRPPRQDRTTTGERRTLIPTVARWTSESPVDWLLEIIS